MVNIGWTFEALLTEEFKVGSEDFADLEVRSSGTEGFGTASTPSGTR